jgi:hypothetical protein
VHSGKKIFVFGKAQATRLRQHWAQLFFRILNELFLLDQIQLQAQ